MKEFKISASTRVFLTLVSSSFFLTACGGSSNGKTPVPEPVIPAPVATITLNDNVTADDIISQNEATSEAPIAITGTTGGNVADGDTVTITVNGTTVTGTVSDNAFSIDVPADDLVADSDSTIEASVTTSTGHASGEATATDSDAYTVEPAPTPTPATISLNSFSQLTQLAIKTGDDIAITGTTGGDVADGDIVTIRVNGLSFTGPVSGDAFSILVPVSDLENNSNRAIEASVSAAEGSSSATNVITYTIETAITASITLTNNITADDTIDQAELDSDAAILITGTTGGDVAEGDTVTLTVNAEQYSGTVNADKAFSIAVPVIKLVENTTKKISATVTTSATDSAGEKTADDVEMYKVTAVIASPTAEKLVDPNPGTDSLPSEFGSEIKVLSNGNIVVVAKHDSSVSTKNGAVHLFNGSTKQIIKSFYGNGAYSNYGSMIIDQLDSITVLPNDNFVINSPQELVDGKSKGKIELINGVTGAVMQTYEGDFDGDKLGSDGVTVLENGNFTIVSSHVASKDGATLEVGSMMLIDGETGSQIEDTRYGSTLFPGYGSNEERNNEGLTSVVPLKNSNGNFMLLIPGFEAGPFKGSIELFDGSNAEAIETFEGYERSNSNLGTMAAALPNGNVVVGSGRGGKGYITIIDGLTGEEIISGRDGVGFSPGDQVGSGGIYVLPNSNVVVASPLADDPSNSLVDAGSIRYYNTDTGELFRTTYGKFAGDNFGNKGVDVLKNGNFVVRSPFSDSSSEAGQSGSVTFFNGDNGAKVNTKYGRGSTDLYGEHFTELTNGNYVISTSSVEQSGQSSVGEVTLFDGTKGTVIKLSVGDDAQDRLGSVKPVALENGNYVYATPGDDVAGVENVGTVTLVNGSTGVNIKTITGTAESDLIGEGGIIALPNSEFIVISPKEAGALDDSGTIKWYDSAGNLKTDYSIEGSKNDSLVGSSVITTEFGYHIVFADKTVHIYPSYVGN